MADEKKLRIKIILAALDTDIQELSLQTGEQRPVLSDIINHPDKRKALRARRRLAEKLCEKVSSLILPADQPEQIA